MEWLLLLLEGRWALEDDDVTGNNLLQDNFQQCLL